MPDIYSVSKLDNDAFELIANSLSPLLIPLEQSPQWGQFDDSLSNRKFLGTYRYDDRDGNLIAIASATLYSERGRDWIWIKHGPLFSTEPNTEILKNMCSTLKLQFNKVADTSPIFIRLSSMTFTKPLVRPFEHTVYDQTVVIDLKQSEESLWFDMSQTSRQEIKKAEKAKINIQKLTNVEAVNIFKKEYYPLLKETSSRNNFGIHPSSIYESMLEKLPAANLYGAYEKDKVIAWAIITVYRNRALYYYGASGETARNNGAAYLLQWNIIKDLKSKNISSYDLMGIAGKHFPNLKNVTGFKMKFSKNVVDVPEAYDLPLKPLKYRLLSMAINLKRRI